MEYGGEEEWVEEEQEKEECAEQCEEGEDDGIFELLFSPENAGDSRFSHSNSIVVDPLFENISNIQLLHPDPVKEEDGEEDGMFMTANGLVSVEEHLVDLFDKADVSTTSFGEMNKQ